MNHVWTYDFIEDQTEDDRKLKLLAVLDEWTRELPAIEVSRSITSWGVITVRGSGFIRSDNRPEFIANAVKQWHKDKKAATLYIEPDCPWENGYIE